MQDARVLRAVPRGLLVPAAGALPLPEAVVTDAQPQAGEEPAAVGVGKADPARRPDVERQLIPEDRVAQPPRLAAQVAQSAARFRARRRAGKTLQQRLLRLPRPLQRAQAARQGEAGGDLILRPPVPLQKVSEGVRRGGVQPAVGELARKVINLPRVRLFAVGKGPREDAQVAEGLARRLAEVGDADRRMGGCAAREHVLVHPSPPAGAGSAHDAHPLEGERAAPVFRGDHGAQEVTPDLTAKRLFERAQGGGVVGAQDLVRVHPHAVVRRRAVKAEVARRGKILPPGEVVHIFGISPRDRLGLVRRTGIDDHDLVEHAGGGIQAAAEHGRLVFYDHAEPERHRGLLLGEAGRILSRLHYHRTEFF